MKSKRLLNVIGQIDDEFIEEAASEEKKINKPLWLKLSAVAACIALILTVGVFMLHIGQPSGKLPMLTVGENQEGAMGFEGYFAHNIDELVNNNPWTEESEIRSLPVYKNSLFRYTKDAIVTDPDIAGMKKALIDAAKRLKMDTDGITINEVVYNNLVSSIYAEDENYKIDVNTWTMVNIDFKKKDILPDGYSLDSNESYDTLHKTAEYLLRKYANFIDMDNPQIDISLGDYDVYGNRIWQVSFYEGAGDMTEKIINYNFKQLSFYCDDSGQLSAAYSYKLLDDVIGIYPIISADQALELLCKGNYVTSVPEGFPGKDKVKKVELIYRNEARDEVFMPYYKFYAQLDFDNISSGSYNLVCFGAYYVPAVEGEYIQNMPQWDGSFN